MRIATPFRLFPSLLAACILSGACTFPVTTSDDFEVHFGRPSNGNVIMLGESFNLLANGSSTAGDVSRVLFFANGSVVNSAPNLAGDIIVAEYVWTPPAAGQYTLQIAAQRSGEYAYSPTINVCVLPIQIAPGHPYDVYAHGYEGDCEIPARSASAILGDPSTATVSANPGTLTYVPLYYEYCPDQTRVVSFKFYINDPHDDIVFASIAVSMVPANMGRINGEATVALTHVSDSPPYRKNFVGELDMHIFLTRSFTIPATGEGLSGEMNWIARAFGRGGEILLEEGPFVIPVEPVNCDDSPISIPTPLPLIIAPTSTSTPASALDCPSGTYFSDAMNKCIAIQIPPTKKPDGSSISCSDHTSKDSCSSAGCSWNATLNKCQ